MSSRSPSKKSGQAGVSRRALQIIAVVAAVAVVLAAYVFLHGSGNGTRPEIYPRSVENVTSAGQRLFYSDLQKAVGLSSIGVVYTVNRNNTEESLSTQNGVVLVARNETITSEELNGRIASVLKTKLVYTSNNYSATNITSLYYYNTPSEITCLNESASQGIVQCLNGTGGLPFLKSFPFTISNITSLKYFGDYNITYTGVRIIDGRECDDFLSLTKFLNSSGNYSLAYICLDQQYGIPLIFNESIVANGTRSNGPFLQLTSITMNVTATNFSVPGKFINESSTLGR